MAWPTMSRACANCEASIPEGASYCDNCGMPVSEEAPPQEEPSWNDPDRLASVLPPQPSSSPPPPLPSVDEQPTIEASSRQEVPESEGRPRRTKTKRIVLLITSLVGLAMFAGVALGVVMLVRSTEGTDPEAAKSVDASSENPNLVSDAEGKSSGKAVAENIVPDLRGKTIGEAASMAGGNYELEVALLTPSPEPKGTIVSASGPISDDPDAILVILSGGQESVVVPDISGLSALEAGEVLIEAGLSPRATLVFGSGGNPVAATDAQDRDIAATEISRTIPEAGSRAEPAESVQLFAPSSDTPL